MGAKSFSHRTPGRTRGAGGHVGASEVGLEGLDHQQALVLGALRRAAGAPVTYAELRAASVELPASVVSELELAGVAIRALLRRGARGRRCAARPRERSRRPTDVRVPAAGYGDRRRARTGMEQRSDIPSLELPRRAGRALTAHGQGARCAARSRHGAEPPNRPRSPDPGPTEAIAGQPQETHPGPHGARPELRSCPIRRDLGAGRRSCNAPPIAKRPHSPRWSRPAARARRRAPVHASTAAGAGVAALATELEAQGHSLLEAERYGDAVAVLKRAVLATGETVGACLEPANSTCLTYAYALYDLGRAVRLTGEPQAAVPLLERRLQIDNQRWVVGAELQLARRGIG